jgi:hypothetical protein
MLTIYINVVGVIDVIVVIFLFWLFIKIFMLIMLMLMLIIFFIKKLKSILNIGCKCTLLNLFILFIFLNHTYFLLHFLTFCNTTLIYSTTISITLLNLWICYYMFLWSCFKYFIVICLEIFYFVINIIVVGNTIGDVIIIVIFIFINIIVLI